MAEKLVIGYKKINISIPFNMLPEKQINKRRIIFK